MAPVALAAAVAAAVELAEVAPMAVRVVAPVAELEGAEGQLAAAVLLVAPEPEALGLAAWVAAAQAAAAAAGVAAHWPWRHFRGVAAVAWAELCTLIGQRT